MIHYLMSKGNAGRAKEIAQSIADKNVPLSIDQMNRIYDVVLNMNSLNSKPADGNHAQVETQYRRAGTPQGGIDSHAQGDGVDGEK